MADLAANFEDLKAKFGEEIAPIGTKVLDGLVWGLQWIKDWCEQRRYVYQHQWRMGDLLIWDNTGTTHRVCDYDHACGRRLHRVTLLGEERLAQAA